MITNIALVVMIVLVTISVEKTIIVVVESLGSISESDKVLVEYLSNSHGVWIYAWLMTIGLLPVSLLGWHGMALKKT